MSSKFSRWTHWVVLIIVSCTVCAKNVSVHFNPLPLFLDGQLGEVFLIYDLRPRCLAVTFDACRSQSSVSRILSEVFIFLLNLIWFSWWLIDKGHSRKLSWVSFCNGGYLNTSVLDIFPNDKRTLIFLRMYLQQTFVVMKKIRFMLEIDCVGPSFGL